MTSASDAAPDALATPHFAAPQFAAPQFAEPQFAEPEADPRLIVALDVPTRAHAEALAERIGLATGFYKIGLQLLATGGMGLAADLKAQGFNVFLDWKLHDIPATVEKAAAAIAETGLGDFLTVHAEPQVMAAAVRGRGNAKGCCILGVTVLTSLSDLDLNELGYGMGVEALVERRIRQAVEAGVDGVIASPHEAAMARRIGGPGFLVVTPGVRPEWSALDDQARAATPEAALKAGASHLVVGRPINTAADPKGATQAIAAEMARVAL